MMSVLSAGWPFREGESFGRVRVGGLGAGAAATRARTVHMLAVARCRLKFPVPRVHRFYTVPVTKKGATCSGDTRDSGLIPHKSSPHSLLSYVL